MGNSCVPSSRRRGPDESIAVRYARGCGIPDYYDPVLTGCKPLTPNRERLTVITCALRGPRRRGTHHRGPDHRGIHPRGNRRYGIHRRGRIHER
jgi:hypothetical protein